VDPVLEFLEFAARTEFTTQGGWLNFVGIGLLGAMVSGADIKDFLFQLLEFLSRTLDRLAHLIEKFLEFLASLAKADFKASAKPGPYQAPRTETAWKPLVAVSVLLLACILALGAARYAALHPNPEREGHPPERHSPEQRAAYKLPQ
jgi:hypothetical protein